MIGEEGIRQGHCASNGRSVKYLRKWDNSVLVALLFAVACVCFAGFASPVIAQDRVELLAGKASEYSKKGNHMAALNMINRAIKMEPRNANLYYTRAFIFGRGGAYANAVRDFTSVINGDKAARRAGKKASFPHAHRFRADCYLVLGQFKLAVRDYETFLDFAPKDGKVWYYLAESYALMGKRGFALDAVSKGLATGSHWSDRLRVLRRRLMAGEQIIPHKPFSN